MLLDEQLAAVAERNKNNAPEVEILIEPEQQEGKVEATPAETRGRLRSLIEKLTGGTEETESAPGARTIFGNLDRDAEGGTPKALVRIQSAW